jgi:hypothetical protein
MKPAPTVLLLIGVLSALLGCGLGDLSGPQAIPPGTGGLFLTVNDSLRGARTLVPPIVMKVDSYDIRGVGPDPAVDTFEQLGIKTGPVAQIGLATGVWTVTVEARNPYVEGDPNQAGTIIGRGEAQATIARGAVTSASVVIVPLAGSGTVTLTVLFPPNTIKKTGSLVGTLTPVAGAPVSLAFTPTPENNPISATHTSNVEAGYYLLSLVLTRDDKTVWGTTEGVRIVAGQATSEQWDLN